MIGCCAKDCNNRNEHVFGCFYFLRMRNEKMYGLRNVAKLHHKMLGYVKIYHFDDLQFKTRQDGWRKLRSNAIPLIFESNFDRNQMRSVGQYKHTKDLKKT